MGDVTVIGLGLMGSALANAFQSSGHDLVVWNRSPAKMQPFVSNGAIGATDVVSAIGASPVTVICIDNYETTQKMLSVDNVIETMCGRVIVQFSSGTPQDAQKTSDKIREWNAHYLDGAILAGPTNIGTDEAVILLAGDALAHQKAFSLLECLGQGTVRYLGTNVRAASTLDLAWLTTRYTNFLAAIHGANICLSEDIGVDEFITLVGDNPTLQFYAQEIHNNRFDEYTASLQVWGEALEHIQQQGIDANINTEIPDFIARLFSRAISAGYGQTNVMSLLKVLQENQSG